MSIELISREQGYSQRYLDTKLMDSASGRFLIGNGQMKFSLSVLIGLNEGCEVSVDVSPFKIGRAADCQLNILCPQVSRHHCELTVHDGRIFIRDLESHNGTFVNGEQVDTSRCLIDGDEIGIGMRLYKLVVMPNRTRRIDRHHEVSLDDQTITAA